MRHVDDVSRTDVRRKATGPKGIDWDAAETFFLALDPPRPLPRVAEKFGVSKTRVGQVARKRKWREKATEIDKRAAARGFNGALRSRQARVEHVLRFVDGYLDAAVTALDASKLEIRASDVPPLVKLTELLLGEATDRVESRRFAEVIVAFLPRLMSGWPKDRQGELDGILDELEAAMAELGTGEVAA